MKDKLKKTIEESISDVWDEYEKKPPEYHDMILRRIFRNSKYAHEPVEKLRELLREQAKALEPNRH